MRPWAQMIWAHSFYIYLKLHIKDGLSCGAFVRSIHTDYFLPVTLLQTALETATITFVLPTGATCGAWIARLLVTDIIMNAISLVLLLRLLCSLIIKTYLDRIQFETCTSKESCTEPSKQTLVRTQHSPEDCLGPALGHGTV